MHDVYKETVGKQQIMKRARLMEAMVERKKIYIDDNLFVGSITGQVNGVYPYPEWNVEWMKEEKTVEKSKTPELKAANEWALDYWDKRSLKTRTEEILAKRYGYDTDAVYGGGLVGSFHDWPGGGGNLNYPLVYQQGIGSVIKDCEERMMSMEMRLPNASKFYFYEASIITMRAFIRLAHRYAELAREKAAQGEGRNPQGGTAGHCRDLRMGSRESCSQLCGKPCKPTSSRTSLWRLSNPAAGIRRPSWVSSWSRTIRPTRLPDSSPMTMRSSCSRTFASS